MSCSYIDFEVDGDPEVAKTKLDKSLDDCGKIHVEEGVTKIRYSYPHCDVIRTAYHCTPGVTIVRHSSCAGSVAIGTKM